MLTGMFSELNPLDTFGTMVKGYLVPQLTDSYNAGVIMLLRTFISGFVALMEKSGGGVAFAKRVTGGQVTSAKLNCLLGFGGNRDIFSDLGTPLIVGPVFRPFSINWNFLDRNWHSSLTQHHHLSRSLSLLSGGVFTSWVWFKKSLLLCECQHVWLGCFYRCDSFSVLRDA